MRCSDFLYILDAMPTTATASMSAQVAAAIRSELAHQGLRQADLAERLGRSEIWVSRRLSPRSNVTIILKLSEVDAIAHALGIETMELFRGVA